MLRRVDERREQLTQKLEALYRRGSVWGEPSRAADGTVRVADCGGVTWIGLPVVPSDLDDEQFPQRLRELSSERTPDGRIRCPIELLPDASCADEVRGLLRELRLEERVSVYSLAA